MPPDIIFFTISSNPPAPVRPFIISAMGSLALADAVSADDDVEAVDEAVVEAFFLVDEEDDDFLEGTQFSLSPSATPASERLSVPSPPDNRLPLCKIFPCLEGAIPL